MATENKTVLVGVLKDRRDFNVLTEEKWYRIPTRYAPKKKFNYLAFYQPAIFGKQGKLIEYYSKVRNLETCKRISLLPDEPNHPRANDEYLKINVGKMVKLPSPIRNIIPRRVVFGFTTIDRLLNSEDILELYDVAPIEQILECGLEELSIKVIPQQYVLINKSKRFRLDFAVFCKNGKIAIECDNQKAHSGKIQTQKDKIKNEFLEIQGWTIMRFSEIEILYDLEKCLKKVKDMVASLGGQI
jgi:very-short-patch-repair endonuclease